jgi:hypothetical protein
MSKAPSRWRAVLFLSCVEAFSQLKSASAAQAAALPLSLFKAIYICNSEGYVVFE